MRGRGLFDLIPLASLFVRAAKPATSWPRTDRATSIQGMTLIYVAARMAVERRGSNFANPAWPLCEGRLLVLVSMCRVMRRRPDWMAGAN